MKGISIEEIATLEGILTARQMAILHELPEKNNILGAPINAIAQVLNVAESTAQEVYDWVVKRTPAMPMNQVQILIGVVEADKLGKDYAYAFQIGKKVGLDEGVEQFAQETGLSEDDAWVVYALSTLVIMDQSVDWTGLFLNGKIGWQNAVSIMGVAQSVKTLANYDPAPLAEAAQVTEEAARAAIGWANPRVNRGGKNQTGGMNFSGGSYTFEQDVVGRDRKENVIEVTLVAARSTTSPSKPAQSARPKPAASATKPAAASAATGNRWKWLPTNIIREEVKGKLIVIGDQITISDDGEYSLVVANSLTIISEAKFPNATIIVADIHLDGGTFKGGTIHLPDGVSARNNQSAAVLMNTKIVNLSWDALTAFALKESQPYT